MSHALVLLHNASGGIPQGHLITGIASYSSFRHVSTHPPNNRFLLESQTAKANNNIKTKTNNIKPKSTSQASRVTSIYHPTVNQSTRTHSVALEFKRRFAAVVFTFSINKFFQSFSYRTGCSYWKGSDKHHCTLFCMCFTLYTTC